MKEAVITVIKRRLRFLIIFLIVFSFFDFYPADLNSAPKRKSSASRKNSAASKKKASSKRKKKKIDRKKKKAKKKKRKKRKSRHRRRARSYNPALAKSMSYELIQKNSPEICALAGFTPTGDNTVKPFAGISDTVSTDPEELFASDDEYIEFIELNPGELLDMDSFKSLWLRYAEGRSVDDMTEAGIYKQELMNVIMDWLGTPYLFGGNSSKSIDCSAFTQRIYLNAAGLLLPRTARTQIDVGRPVLRDELEFGDLIFFHTYSYKFPSHVGIYLGDGLFVHASSRWGVVVSELTSDYYRTHFIGARRLTVHDVLRYGNNGDKKESESSQ